MLSSRRPEAEGRPVVTAAFPTSSAQVAAYDADTAMRLHGSPTGEVYVLRADGAAMHDGATVSELGGNIAQVAHGDRCCGSAHTLVLKGG